MELLAIAYKTNVSFLKLSFSRSIPSSHKMANKPKAITSSQKYLISRLSIPVQDDVCRIRFNIRAQSRCLISMDSYGFLLNHIHRRERERKGVGENWEDDTHTKGEKPGKTPVPSPPENTKIIFIKNWWWPAKQAHLSWQRSTNNRHNHKGGNNYHFLTHKP